MSGYLFKVSALLAVLQKQILRIGIRFGSKGFGSKLRGDLKISFDIKRKTFAVKNKRLYLHRKSVFGCQTCLFFLCFRSITDPFEEWPSSDIIKNVSAYTHLIKIFIYMRSKISLLSSKKKKDIFSKVHCNKRIFCPSSWHLKVLTSCLYISMA